MAQALFALMPDRHGGSNPFRVSSEVMFPTLGSLLTQMDAPYNDEIAYVLSYMHSAGLFDQIIRRHVPPRSLLKVKEDIPEIKTMTLEHFVGGFIIWAIVLALSVLTFLFEMFHGSPHRY